jgi:hypothetical protein
VTPRALARLLAAYLVVLCVACLGLAFTLHVSRSTAPKRSVVSVWHRGHRIARAVVSEHAEQALAQHDSAPGTLRVIEDVLDEAPLLTLSPALFGLSFVPARDGIEVTYGGHGSLATPDDLVKIGAYNSSVSFGDFKLKFGVDAKVAFAYFARELDVPVDELLAHGKFRRLSMRRRPPAGEVTAPDVNVTSLDAAVRGAGGYLARSVDADGKFRYEVDGATGEETPDYNLPRHAGATWYLAQAARHSGDAQMRAAVQRAARHVISNYYKDCGSRRCVTGDESADLGSSALALLAFVELVESDIAPELLGRVTELSEFLRSQQREDGEFKHLYDRDKREAIDVQFLYYSGEAAFALSRAYRVTHDRRNLDAARRALTRLVEQPFWYIGWRYYWGAEHWTCHALDDLWDDAPVRAALDFCLDWQEFVRNTAVEGREASPEYDGASTSGPFVPPQLVVTATRMEAAVATLSAARRAKISASRLEALERGIQRSFAFLLRYQYLPGPTHLMPDPDMMHGGVPASETDFHVRIDYPQHAAAGWVEYISLLQQQTSK